MQATEPKHGLAQRPQALSLQLKTNDEHEERDAKFSGLQYGFRFVNHAERGRADEHARYEIAHDRAEAQFLKQRHEKDRSGE